jgi:hypothetical protein
MRVKPQINFCCCQYTAEVSYHLLLPRYGGSPVSSTVARIRRKSPPYFLLLSGNRRKPKPILDERERWR